MEDPKDVRIRELEAEVRRLQELVAEALGRLSKNFSNSSKPPSSDIVSLPKQSDKNRKKPKRKQGAQKGHTRNLRVDFTPDQIDSRHTTTLSIVRIAVVVCLLRKSLIKFPIKSS